MIIIMVITKELIYYLWQKRKTLHFFIKCNSIYLGFFLLSILYMCEYNHLTHARAYEMIIFVHIQN